MSVGNFKSYGNRVIVTKILVCNGTDMIFSINVIWVVRIANFVLVIGNYCR